MLKLVLSVVILVVIAVVAKFFSKDLKQAPDLSVYKRKSYLFDTSSELELFKFLLELFGGKYHIFAQVNYSHLIEPKRADWRDKRKFRSRIDRKSADFVLCDKQRVVPQLIIELDGSAHGIASKRKRDEFIDDLTKIVGLPILHLKTANLDRDFIKAEVEKKLIPNNI